MQQGGGELRVSRRLGAALRCAVCHDALGREERWSCSDCATLAHEECVASGCPTLGCAASPAAVARRGDPDEVFDSEFPRLPWWTLPLSGAALGAITGPVAAWPLSGVFSPWLVLLGAVAGTTLGVQAALLWERMCARWGRPALVGCLAPVLTLFVATPAVLMLVIVFAAQCGVPLGPFAPLTFAGLWFLAGLTGVVLRRARARAGWVLLAVVASIFVLLTAGSLLGSLF